MSTNFQKSDFWPFPSNGDNGLSYFTTHDLSGSFDTGPINKSYDTAKHPSAKRCNHDLIVKQEISEAITMKTILSTSKK